MTFFTEATPLRKALLALGSLAFLAGAVLIAVALVSSLGGGDDEPEIELRDLGDTPSATAAPSATDRPTDTPAPETPTPTPAFAEGAYTMVIDTLGVSAPVQTYGLDANAVPEVPVGDNAASIVAWYNFSQQPGTGGNAVFAGHVTWFGPAVFYALTSISDGDEIKLIGQDGTELTYAVSDVFQVDANDRDSLRVMSRTEDEVLTIITCDGDFIDTNDPIFGGEYPYRLVVRAARVDASVAAISGAD